MTALSVLLGVAFFSGSLVFGTSLSEAYVRSAEQSFDHLDVRIRPVGTGGFVSSRSGVLLDQGLLERAGAVPGVESAAGVVAGFTALAGRDGRLLGEGWATLGMSDDGRFRMAQGRAPQGSGEFAIDARTAERAGFAIGETVRLSVSGPVLEWRLVGIFMTDDGNVAAGGTLTLFDTATAQALLAQPGHYTRIDLAAEPGVSPEELRGRVTSLLPPGTEAVTAAELVTEQAGQNAASVKALADLLLVSASIALFVGGFLIVNTFTMLVAQRTREIALLRAVGASRRQVTGAVLAEAALVGLVASAAGLLVGVGIGALVRAVLSASDANLPDGPLVVSGTSIVVGLAFGLGVTVVAAWLPARRAGRIAPVAALGGLHAPATVRSLVARNTVGAVVAGMGTALVVMATAADGDDGRWFLGLGAVALLIGAFVLTPLLSRPVIAVLAPVLRRFGASGVLAWGNALRNPRRTATTAAALTIGLTLTTTLTVVATGAARATESLAASDFLRADYIVSMANGGPLAADTDALVRELDGVVATSPVRDARAVVAGVDQPVTGLNLSEIDQLLDLGLLEGSFAPGDTAVVDQATAATNGWAIGDRIEVVWTDGALGSLEITGIFDSSFDRGIKTNVSAMDPHLERPVTAELYVRTAGGPSEATRRALSEALGDSPAIRIQDRDDLVDDIAGLINVALNILYGMLLLAFVVAVLGVVNTMAMSVHERTREIGLLRAVGLDRAGVRRMVQLESLVICLFGGVLGVGLGVFLGWAVGDLAASVLGIDTYSFALPWGRLALFLGVSAFVGVVAALGPARRAARLDVLVATRAE